MPDNLEPLFKTEWIPSQESVLVIGVRDSVTIDEGISLREQVEALLPQGCRAMVISGVSALAVISGTIAEDIPTE